LLQAGDDDLMVGVTGADGAVEGIPLSTFFVVGARQLGLNVLHEGTLAQTPEGPTISTFRRREGKGPIREPEAPCMVLVKTTGILTSSMFTDEVQEGRVARTYLPESDMTGVRVLARGPEQFLLELLPNASFRIEAAAGTLTVRWAGWDRPRPTQLTREYLERHGGLQVRSFVERKREAATG
jgi:hypothetical protein